MLAPHPRYRELFERAGSPEPGAGGTATRPMPDFTAQDWRDLQTWFHLAWTDPWFRDREPIRALMVKGRGYTEGEKESLLRWGVECAGSVAAAYRKLEAAGQIEVSTSAYHHPDPAAPDRQRRAAGALGRHSPSGAAVSPPRGRARAGEARCPRACGQIRGGAARGVATRGRRESGRAGHACGRGISLGGLGRNSAAGRARGRGGGVRMAAGALSSAPRDVGNGPHFDGVSRPGPFRIASALRTRAGTRARPRRTL